MSNAVKHAEEIEARWGGASLAQRQRFRLYRLLELPRKMLRAALVRLAKGGE